MKSVTIAAFGALNQDSYKMFGERLAKAAHRRGLAVKLVAAGPYPNAEAVSEPGRPLRAEALQDEEKRSQLLAAVASDAHGIDAQFADMLCMPCMSMIGFHDDIVRTLGHDIFSLGDALAERYRGADRVGVIHMRPAKQRIIEIFGNRALTPDEAQAARLLAAEGSPAVVEAVMKEIAESWRSLGLKRILFARADAPLAEKGPAKIPGVEIESHFGVLAEAMVAACAE